MREQEEADILLLMINQDGHKAKEGEKETDVQLLSLPPVGGPSLPPEPQDDVDGETEEDYAEESVMNEEISTRIHMPHPLRAH